MNKSYVESILLCVMILFVANCERKVTQIEPGTADYVGIEPKVTAGAPVRIVVDTIQYQTQTRISIIPVRLSIPGFYQKSLKLNGDDFVDIELSGGSYTTKVGKPKVPIVTAMIAIPPGTEISDVKISVEEVRRITDITLVPVLPSPEIQAGKITKVRKDITLEMDKRAYKADEAYPAKFWVQQASQEFGGLKVVVIEFHPVQYSAGKKELVIYDLKCAIHLKGEYKVLNRIPEDLIRNLAQNVIVNNINAQYWTPIPVTLPEGLPPINSLRTKIKDYMRVPVKESLFVDMRENHGGWSPTERWDSIIPVDSMVTYIVIYAPDFEKPAWWLCLWRNSRGISSKAINVKDIYNVIPGSGDKPSKIRSFIAIMHQQYRTRYITLLGDVERNENVTVPTRYVTHREDINGCGCDCSCSPFSLPSNIPCDYYYACLNGNWDGDNDGVYGEAEDNPDLLPEVIVSRLPADSWDDAKGMVNAIIEYEQQQPPRRYAILASGETFSWAPGHEQDFKSNTIGPIFSPHFSVVHELHEYTGTLDFAHFVKLFNTGVDAVQYYDHGSPDAWYMSQGSVQFLNSGQVVNNLISTPQKPTVYGFVCSSGGYDNYECIGEAFVENQRALHYIGSTRIAYGYDENTGLGLDKLFWKCYVLPYRWGEAGFAFTLAKAKFYTAFPDPDDDYARITLYEWHLFGDSYLKHN